MPTVAERVSVVEVQVANLDEKIDEIKVDVKDTNGRIIDVGAKLEIQLKTMYEASCTQHAELASKISELEKFKMKWMYMILGGIAVLGWISGHWDTVKKFFE